MGKSFNFDNIISSSTQINNNVLDKIISDKSESPMAEIDISLLDIINDQPFREYDEDALNALKDSIKENGLLSPLVVNKNGNRYTVLAGRNRYRACTEIGWTKIPCIVLEVDEASANLILVDSNLNQRQQLLPSEKALGYKLQIESIAAIRNISFYAALEELAKNENVTCRNVLRYVKLASLTKELLNHVDSGSITFTGGVILTEFNGQKTLAEYLNNNKKKINDKKAQQLLEYEKSNSITSNSLDEFFNEKPEKERKSVKLSYSHVSAVLKNSEAMTDEEIEAYIINAIDFYNQHRDKE